MVESSKPVYFESEGSQLKAYLLGIFKAIQPHEGIL